MVFVESTFCVWVLKTPYIKSTVTKQRDFVNVHAVREKN